MKFRFFKLAIVVAICVVVQDTNAAKIECSNLLATPAHFHCCPTPELVTADLLDKCDEFMHPKYELTNKHAGYDPSTPWENTLPSKANHKQRTTAGMAMTYPCFLECIVNNTDIIDDQYEVNEPQLSQFLEVIFKDDTDLLPLMKKSFRVCATLVRQLHGIQESSAEEAHLSRNSNPMIRERCPTLLASLFSCAVLRTFIKCPSTVWYSTQECNENREAYRKCIKYL